MVGVKPMLFATPDDFRLIVGDITACETSRNAVNRESPAFSPSSWLPAAISAPPMLHTRAGEFDGPHRSLYVRFDSASMWKDASGGLPLERHTSTDVSLPTSGKRLSMALAPPFSAT